MLRWLVPNLKKRIKEYELGRLLQAPVKARQREGGQEKEAEANDNKCVLFSQWLTDSLKTHVIFKLFRGL